MEAQLAESCQTGATKAGCVYSVPGAPCRVRGRRSPVRNWPGAARAGGPEQPGASPIVPSPRPEPAVASPLASALGRSWRGWLGLLVSAAFLALAFRGLHPSDVWAVLRQVDPRWLAPALLLYAAGVWLRAVRWTVLLRPVARMTPGAVVPATLAGYTANNILPLRTGELVRAYLLGNAIGVRKSPILASIAVERLFDGLTMLAFLLAAMTAISPTVELRRLALLAAMLFAAAVVVLATMVLAGHRRDYLLDPLLRPLPDHVEARVRSAATAFLDGLGSLRRGSDLLLVAITSVAAWACEAAMYWAVARGFGAALAPVMTGPAAVLTTAVANLATLVPAAPGYVGTFEAGVLLALVGALGVGRALALSYALLLHAALWLPVTLVGAWCWWRLIGGRRLPSPPPAVAVRAEDEGPALAARRPDAA